MPIHFAEKELDDRKHAVCESLKSRNLDGLLMFRQESMYYLTGYDTFGYSMFQCLFLQADGKSPYSLVRPIFVRPGIHRTSRTFVFGSTKKE